MGKENIASKKDLVVSAALAVASLSVAADSGTFAVNNSNENSYPVSDDFNTGVLEDVLPSQAPTSPLSEDRVVEFPPLNNPLSEEEKRDQRINEKFLQIEDVMKKHTEVFGSRIEDFEMYGRIYLHVSEKYNVVPWYLIFIVHEAETGASKGEAGFSKGSYYKGAMQRDPHIWPQPFVDKAAKGLEDLATLPQRHENDWKEIAAGARILGRNIALYESRGSSKDKAILNALLLYSARVPALSRFKTYNIYKGIFSEINSAAQKKPQIKKVA